MNQSGNKGLSGTDFDRIVPQNPRICFRFAVRRHRWNLFKGIGEQQAYLGPCPLQTPENLIKRKLKTRFKNQNARLKQ